MGKEEKEKAIDHLETTLGIATPFDWKDQLFWIHRTLAMVFGRSKEEFDDANVYVERAKSHAVDDVHNLAHAMEVQALIWCGQHGLGLWAVEIFEKLGAAGDIGNRRAVLRLIEEEIESRSTDPYRCEFSYPILSRIPANLTLSHLKIWCTTYRFNGKLSRCWQ